LLAEPINTFAVKPAPVGGSGRMHEPQFCAMSSQAFEDRYVLLQDLRKQGHVELSDFLGSYDVAPLRELGLLEPSGHQHPFERYGGLMPSTAGSFYLQYDYLRQVIVVKNDQAEDLHAYLMFNAQPLWLPTGNDNGTSFSWAGHHTYDPAIKDRHEMERLLSSGYLALDEVWNVHRIDILQMIAARLCEYRLKDTDGLVYTLQPTEKGDEYLYGAPALGQLLLKPGMGAELFKACLRDSEERLGATG